MSRTFTTWDQAMARDSPDFNALYNQLKSMSRVRASANNAELWWRLSLAAYSLTLNLDPVIDREATKVRTAEAKRYAEKALKLSPNNFNANMWMAIAAGQLALLEDFDRALENVTPLAHHLAKCLAQQPESNWRLLLLECNMHLLLWYSPPEYQEAFHRNSSRLPGNLKRIDLPTIEKKLHQALQLKPDSLEVYGSLVIAFIFGDKLTQAQQAGNAALKLKRNGYRSEERLVQVLQELLLMIKAKPGGGAK